MIKKENLFSTLSALSLGLIHFLFSLTVCIFGIWLIFALWIHKPLGRLFTPCIIAVWIIFSLSIIGIYFSELFFSRKVDIAIFLIGVLLSLLWYFNITPQQNRQWAPEVSRLLSYSQHGNLVTLNNVRNFKWHQDKSYEIHWETRTFDLSQITGVNIITSYWMGPQIAHTLVSFNFEKQRPIVFSIEIRKQANENFSAIGGFFRQFELSLVASDEKDILYTRSNIRKEKVFFFPIRMQRQEMRNLFEEYLVTADHLKKSPQWYNTLTSNCTTIVFDMVQAVNPHELPKDYRILLSGYLPNYLYDTGALDRSWSIKEWYEHAYINPRTQDFSQFKDQSSEHFSRLIRQGLPQATSS
ncbi:DUF4105 domain-containing protein [Acinetobacter nectaris]|uniref:lipoprotein N-acyltransferase Lnb domain-containing protein n=1 Tax=Acinetobacter nectaris TaxID=1219382 RepID=UPI001F3215FE|nr:DUF4105 domain-containing protein [Acinetobacter nectaris]MCF8998634.1 DUF4105 domain-containing protein [Acinetobacter nectaris]MCF9027748.1 DUF4105 domain-containing protein [Acinetobacter nectaris]